MTDPGPVLRNEGVSMVGDGLEAFMPLLAANVKRIKRRKNAKIFLSPIELLLGEALTRLGLTYEMQYPVGPYDADFYFHDALLCVEVDGKQHAERREQDERRDQYFRDRGIETVRITGREVHKDAAGCAQRIAQLLEEAS